MMYELKQIIDEAETMKNAHFFRPPCNAAGRREYERFHSHAQIEWVENGDVYTAEYTVTCTCSSVCAKGNYTRNGKKVTLTAIRNSYNRIMVEKLYTKVKGVLK